MTSCSRNDSKLNKLVCGDWDYTNGTARARQITISQDGSWASSPTNLAAGTWRVSDGVVIFTTTHVDRWKIISVDDHQITFEQEDGKTNTLIR